MKIAVTLHGQAVAMALSSIAWEYAFKSINRVATVREAPTFDKAREARWRDLRDTLESALGETLPDVGEPDWPARYLFSDRIVTKSHSLGPFRVVDETKVRKGAKKLPTYNRSLAAKRAEAWRDEFLKRLGVAIEPTGGES